LLIYVADIADIADIADNIAHLRRPCRALTHKTGQVWRHAMQSRNNNENISKEVVLFPFLMTVMKRQTCPVL
jgi:hypothetical protein